MATRGKHASTLDGLAILRRLPAVALAGLAIQGAACASATVGDVGTHDAASDSATSGSGTGGGKGGSGGAGGNGGATGGSSGVCDPFTNSGCSSDQKCTTLQSGSSLAVGCGSKGDRSEGDTCTPVSNGGSQTGDDCGTGLACFKLASDPSSTCHRICNTTGTSCTCPADELCSLVVGDLGGLAFCRAVAKCQPIEQQGCQSGAGEGCYFSTSSCYTGSLCAKAGSTRPGDSCTVANDCEPGSTCLIVGSSGTCSSFCSTASSTCSGSSTGGDMCAALGGSNDEANLGSCRPKP